MPDNHQLIEEEIRPHRVGARTASAALLAWFLYAVWRIEPEDIDDAICDGAGDKGIDGLLVNEDLNEITILQAKHRESPDRGQGDADLERLVGAAAFFETPEAVDQLIRARPNPELLRLLARLDIRERVAQGAHATRLVFVTNGALDPAGRDYLAAVSDREPPLEVWDSPKLAAVARRTRRPELLPAQVTLHAAAPPTQIVLEHDVPIAVALVPATELVELPGIEDLSLFDRNVRLSEGRTRINRELGETIDNEAEHSLFPAYHNGLTMLTHELSVEASSLTLDGVTVVNGCQSLLTLYGKRNEISNALRLLVKVVQVERQTDLADKITYRSNNQNPVDIRDQRSTDVIQRDLQAQVAETYGDYLFYSIRQGETTEAPETLSNQTAAQFLMAIYLEEPWNAVRKVRLFDHDYRRIFGRDVDAHRLFLIHNVQKVVESVRQRLRPDLASSFASVRFTLAHLLAQMLRQTEHGTAFLATPDRWLPDLTSAVNDAMTGLAQEVVDSVNFFIEEEEQEKGDSFDPKVVFKSQRGVADVESQVLRLGRRLAKQDPTYFFELEPVR